MFEDRKIPDFILEQFVLGELSNEKYDDIKQRLLYSSDLRERLEAIERSNKNFNLPINNFRIEKMQENNAVSLKLNNKYNSFSLAFAACFIFIVAVPMWPSSPDVNLMKTQLHIEEPGIRLKGIQPELQIFQKQGFDIKRLKDEDEVKQNDNLQLSYIAAGLEYGVIFSVDGRGEVTLHYPDDASSDTRVNEKKLTALEYAYRLDDAPLFERFFLITSSNPLDVQALLKSGRELASNPASAKKDYLAINGDVKQTSILLNKVKK